MSRDWNAGLAVLLALLLLRSSGTAIDAPVLIGAMLGALLLVTWPRLFPRRPSTVPREPALVHYSVRYSRVRVRWLIYRAATREQPARAPYEGGWGQIWDTQGAGPPLLEEERPQ